MFPKNILIGCLWLKAMKNPALIDMPYASVRKRQYRVCRFHFSDDCWRAGYATLKLKDGAVPTLNLPDGQDINQSEEAEINLNTFETMDTSQEL